MWGELSAIQKRTNDLSAGEILSLGKLINDFIDGLISFSRGQANKRLPAQQEVIDEHSTPVISIVDGVAVLPIIGDIDKHRARILMEYTLSGTKNQEVDCLIMDFSAVFIVNIMVAQELLR